MTGSDAKQTGWFRRLWERLGDRGRWPRCWWYPLPPDRDYDSGRLPGLHEKCSETVRRAMLTLLGFSLFCLLTALGASDASLVGAQAEIKIPFANVPISFIAFLIVAPLLLIVLSIYLHVFVGHLRELEAEWLRRGSKRHGLRLPTLFNFDAVVPRMLTAFIFHWLPPLVLAAITWKAMAIGEFGVWMGGLTLMMVFALLFLQIRRCTNKSRQWLNGVYWLGLVLILGATTQLGELHRPLDLYKVDLRNAWLPHADLRHANLGFAALNGAKLQSANLSGADLTWADLRDADLSKANLSRARLVAADLREADLTFATLSDADLSSADLSGANLHIAGLLQAKLDLTNLSGTNLLGVRFWHDFHPQDRMEAVKAGACRQLDKAIFWWDAYRNFEMACGMAIPEPLSEEGQ